MILENERSALLRQVLDDLDRAFTHETDRVFISVEAPTKIVGMENNFIRRKPTNERKITINIK